MARRICAVYGTLHALALPSEAPISRYLTSRRSDIEWEKLAERAHAARKPWAERLDEALPALSDLRTIEADGNGDEMILCNCHLIPEHVRLGHNDELVVTEWAFAGSLTPRPELGSALVHWTLRPLVNPKTIEAFRDGYLHAAGR